MRVKKELFLGQLVSYILVPWAADSSVDGRWHTIVEQAQKMFDELCQTPLEKLEAWCSIVIKRSYSSELERKITGLIDQSRIYISSLDDYEAAEQNNRYTKILETFVLKMKNLSEWDQVLQIFEKECGVSALTRIYIARHPGFDECERIEFTEAHCEIYKNFFLHV